MRPINHILITIQPIDQCDELILSPFKNWK